MNIGEPVASIMSKDPVHVTRRQKISDVWRILSGGRIHHLPVVEDGRLVGIISTLDLAKLGVCPLEDGEELTTSVLDGRLTVEQLMQRSVVSLGEDATVADAARMLSAGGFHALPVVDRRHHLVGIVTTTDLIGYLLRILRVPEDPRAAAGGARSPGGARDALAAVLKAAEAYLRSGHGEREHAALERAVEADVSRAQASSRSGAIMRSCAMACSRKAAASCGRRCRRRMRPMRRSSSGWPGFFWRYFSSSSQARSASCQASSRSAMRSIAR
jgi:CBS domain-containing protein